MPSNRLSLFLRDASGYGWSESYYWNGGTVTFGVIPPSIQALFTARMALSGSDILLTHLRLESNPRNPIVYTLNNGSGVSGSQAPPTAPSEVALLVRFNAGTSGFNRVFLRGIPEAQITGDRYTPVAPYPSLVTAYAAAVTASGFFNAVGTPSAGTTPFSLGTLNPTPPRGFTLTVSGITLVQGQLVRIHGTKVPGYSGLKTVTRLSVASPGTYYMGGAAPAAPDSSAGSFLTIPVPYDAGITSVTIEGLSRRAAGRPFGLSRGRRPTLYSLRQ